MAKTEKTPNFSAEQTVELVNAYKLATTTESRKAVVSAYAAKFGKPEASIRMKLVREQVYVKPKATTKTGEPIVDKEKLADRLADEIAAFIPEPLDEASVSSLAKANKKALKAILKVVSELSAFKKQAMESFENMDTEDESEVTE